MERQRWGSRASFILAAIGSAAGLGNAIRFPYVAYSNGGGAFLIPYFVALLTAGIPLLVMEFAIGQKNQAGAPVALGKINKRFEYFGWWQVVCAFVIVCYYAVIMSWICNFLVGSINVAWGTEPMRYFTEDVLKVSDSPGNLSGFSLSVLVGLLVTWVAVYLILRKGTESVGKVIGYTVAAPVVLLLILIIRAVTLPGALEGLNYFLKPDFAALLGPRVWIEAYTQVFYSLSLAMAIMCAYASYMPEDSDITNNALIIVFADACVSFLAGLAIFGTLGHMSLTQGVPIKDVAIGGIRLSFDIFPAAINTLPGGRGVVAVFGFVFFATLLTLGIDSTFSLVEAVITAVADKWKLDKHRTTVGVILVMALVSLIFATKAGLHWLDLVDHYINSYGLIIAGITEAVLIGWFYNTDSLRQYFNPISEYKFGRWWTYMIKIIPFILFVLLAVYFVEDIKTPYEGYASIYQWIGGWGLIIAVGVASFVITKFIGKKNIAETGQTVDL